MTRKNCKGFTIVELIVTITILVILTTLVVVRLGSTQADGRDQERKIDVETIATGLELYYENGNAKTFTPKGYYPGAAEFNTAAALTPPFHEFLEGVSKISLEAPGMSVAESFKIDPNYTSSPIGGNSDGSYTDAQARALLAQYPYIYQPLQRNNTFCASYVNCVKFNLYYLNEMSDAVVQIRSKRQ